MRIIYFLTLLFLTSSISSRQDFKLFSSRMKNIKSDGEEFVDSIVKKAISSGIVAENPLVIIDAIALDNSKIKQGQYSILFKEDIESISVLEGEKAIPIYGDKGKNGLILITRKEIAQKYLEYYLRKNKKPAANSG